MESGIIFTFWRSGNDQKIRVEGISLEKKKGRLRQNRPYQYNLHFKWLFKCVYVKGFMKTLFYKPLH